MLFSVPGFAVEDADIVRHMRKFMEAPGAQIEEVDDLPLAAQRRVARCVAYRVARLDSEGHVLNIAEVREMLAILGLSLEGLTVESAMR